MNVETLVDFRRNSKRRNNQCNDNCRVTRRRARVGESRSRGAARVKNERVQCSHSCVARAMDDITQGLARMRAGSVPAVGARGGASTATAGGGGVGQDGGDSYSDDYLSDGSYTSGSYDSRSYSYSSSRSYDSRRRGDDDDASYSRSYSGSYSYSESYSRSNSDDDAYSDTGSDMSRVAKSSSSASTDSQATLSASSAYSDKEDDDFEFAGKSRALYIAQLGDVRSQAIEAGPEANPRAFDMFMADIRLIRGVDAFETEYERELFKKAFVKQIVFKEAEIVLKELQSWDDESRECKAGGYFVYFVIRGALAATKLVHPRYAAVHTPEAMAHLDHPMSILKPITMQTPMIFQDAQFETDEDRQRAKAMLQADHFSSVELAKFIRGSCFGEYEVLEGRIPRQYTITSLVSNTAVAVMPAHVFEKFARKGSELRRRIDAERTVSALHF